MTGRSIPRRAGLNGKKLLTLIVLIGPAFVLFTVLVIFPVFQAAWYSLYKWNGLGPPTDFSGARNYLLLARDPIFGKALLHNALIVVFSLLVELPLALALALIVGRGKFPMAVFFRTFFFLPYVLSEVIAGVLWKFIYNPQYGLINTVLSVLSPGRPGVAPLASPDSVFWAILVVIIWKYFGLYMTIYIAGLQGIPQELEEAARMDGATGGQVIRYVVLPLLLGTIQISVFFSIIGSLQIFDLIWAMGMGDPVNGAETMVTYLYKYGFQRFNIGFGSSVAMVIFFMCLVFSVLYQRILLREER
jgi:raffinose/stachyose/melibiose transport system permease protein